MYGAESRARDGAGDRAKKVLVLSPLARKTSHFWDWRRSQEHDPVELIYSEIRSEMRQVSPNTATNSHHPSGAKP